MRFSERHGYTPVRQIVQIESVDEALRNSLWSILKIHIWDKVHHSAYSTTFQINRSFETFCQRFWFRYFKLPLDTLNDEWNFVYKFFRTRFFEAEWFEVYDFVEFVAENFPYEDRDSFIAGCNIAFQTEMSAYRFVDGKIARITSEQEISEIEEAVRGGRDPVQIHLRRALELLSDRKNPDYRNSIKESISSVESLVQIILGKKGTLGSLIKKLEVDIGLHPALVKAFDHLYGYTSDESGIRHAILESGRVNFEDAKFFLVVCSAFVNFVNVNIKARP